MDRIVDMAGGGGAFQTEHPPAPFSLFPPLMHQSKFSSLIIHFHTPPLAVTVRLLNIGGFLQRPDIP